MALGDMGKDDVEQTDEDSAPSVSYLYIYEEGRDELEGWSEQAAEVAARAYELASGNGTVRDTFAASAQFENIHHAISHLIAAMGEAFEEDNWTPLLEFVTAEDPEAAADILEQYLDEKDDLREELLQRFETAEAAPADD